MAEHEIVINSDDFPSNSNKSKAVQEEQKPQKLEKIVEGGVKKSKPSILKKVTKAIFCDVDEEDLRTQIIFDYIIPTAKDTIVSIINMVTDTVFYGSTGAKRKSTTNNPKPARVSYSSYYDNKNEKPKAGRTATYDFDQITLDSRGDAEKVIDAMIDMSSEYGAASVGDFLDLVGVDNNFTDYKYGWSTDLLTRTTITRSHNGYIINFPNPTHLD